MSIQDASIRAVWPSAFQWIEQPLYNLNDERNQSVQNHQPTSYSTYAWSMARQYVYWPLVMALTPLTCVADMVAGVAEAGFSLYQEASLSRASSILHKKLIASPIQHMVFLSGSILVPVMIGLVCNRKAILRELVVGGINRDFSTFKSSIKFSVGLSTVLLGPLCGLLSYQLVQRAVAKLPNWTHPEGFNIFINGGCLDPSGQKFTDPDYVEKLFKAYKENRSKNNFNTIEEKWADYIKVFQNQIPAYDSLDKFETFSNAVKKGLSPQKCLELNDKPTLDEIKKAYLKWTLVLHPDRNPFRQDIATILFKALGEARVLLDEEFKNNK